MPPRASMNRTRALWLLPLSARSQRHLLRRAWREQKGTRHIRSGSDSPTPSERNRRSSSRNSSKERSAQRRVEGENLVHQASLSHRPTTNPLDSVNFRPKFKRHLILNNTFIYLPRRIKLYIYPINQLLNPYTIFPRRHTTHQGCHDQFTQQVYFLL